MKGGYEIIFEDEDLCIVNKAPNWLTIPDRFDPTRPNLQKALQQKYGQIWVVHRLDQDTSGLLCFAKSAEAHIHLSKQFSSWSVKKIYLALIDGIPPEDQGEIERPIATHPSRPGQMIVSKRGKTAHTSYQLLETFRNFSFANIQLHTGRTHQIRVHFQAIGHPLAVDPMYGRRSALFLSSIKQKAFRLGKGQEERPIMERCSLHAHQLELLHPKDNKKMAFEAPYPKDFKAILNQLRKWGK